MIPRPDVANEDEEEDLPIVVDGYVWGADVRPLLAHIAKPPGREEGGGRDGAGPKFDVLVLADLLFWHSEHGNMLSSLANSLSKKRAGKAFVVFTSYRPWLAHEDLAFFDLAREQGFEVEQIFERKMDRHSSKTTRVTKRCGRRC